MLYYRIHKSNKVTAYVTELKSRKNEQKLQSFEQVFECLRSCYQFDFPLD